MEGRRLHSSCPPAVAASGVMCSHNYMIHGVVGNLTMTTLLQIMREEG